MVDGRPILIADVTGDVLYAPQFVATENFMEHLVPPAHLRQFNLQDSERKERNSAQRLSFSIFPVCITKLVALAVIFPKSK